MKNSAAFSQRVLLATIAMVGWCALIMQLYLIIVNRNASMAETVTRFFSFFTIQNNMLVTVCSTLLLVMPNSKWGAFFSKQNVLAAIALYIAVVGIVYNVILRFQWQPQGLQRVTDELLHTVLPLLFVFYWIRFAAKNQLQYKHIFPWLIYPFLYCIYTMVRGEFAAYYPYPFINVLQLGYGKVLMNTFFLVIFFLLLSLLMVWIAKRVNR